MENLTIRDGVAEASTAANANVRVRRSRPKRQHLANAIQIEELESGKPTTTAGPANLISGDKAQAVDERRFKVIDGFLDPNSNYTGFIEVIGRFITIATSDFSAENLIFSIHTFQ